MRLPVLQVRVIASDDNAAALVAEMERHARSVFGDDVTYRTQTRQARRVGYSRVYLTATREEERL